MAVNMDVGYLFLRKSDTLMYCKISGLLRTLTSLQN
jgi:hypothetical protein